MFFLLFCPANGQREPRCLVVLKGEGAFKNLSSPLKVIKTPLHFLHYFFAFSSRVKMQKGCQTAGTDLPCRAWLAVPRPCATFPPILRCGTDSQLGENSLTAKGR